MSKSSVGMSTTFALGSSDMHRVPTKPWAPAQAYTPLDDGFARAKNARAAARVDAEFHPNRVRPAIAGVSPWDHASPQLRASLSNMTSHDELDRRLKYYRLGRVELSMLQGMLGDFHCQFHEEEQFPTGEIYHYYLMRDERNGVRGFLCLVLQHAGEVRGGGTVAGRVEHSLEAYYWVDAIEGNELALHEEREKLRRRKAREERLAREQAAAAEAERQAREAQVAAAEAATRTAEKEARHARLRQQVKAVQRRILTQVQTRNSASVYSLMQTFDAMDQDKSYTLDRRELTEGMSKQGLSLSENEVDLLINFYDNDGRGHLNYAELVEALKGELNERRFALVSKAFRQLDPDGTGLVSLDSVATSYHAREHPDVKARLRTEAEVLREFLLGFERQANAQGQVTFSDFERYFAVHSRQIDDDDYFAAMMRHAWGVREE